VVELDTLGSPTGWDSVLNEGRGTNEVCSATANWAQAKVSGSPRDFFCFSFLFYPLFILNEFGGASSLPHRFF
jgi:hypothetical protein